MKNSNNAGSRLTEAINCVQYFILIHSIKFYQK